VTKVLLSTLLLDIFSCIVTGLFALFNESSFQAFLYVAFLTFGSILIPTFLGVLIFQFVKKKINFPDKTQTFVVQILVMLLLMFIGLLLWALFDVIVWSDTLTLENVTHDFHSQFSGFVIGGIFMAIALPFIDSLLTKKKYADK
jgi:hypothetical protein